VSQKEIAKSLDLLEKDWEIDPIIKDFHLQRRDDVSENVIKIKMLFFIFHIYRKKKNLYSGNVTGQTVQIVVQGREGCR